MVDEPMDLLDPDAELMVAVQKGDNIAFDQLVYKYHKPIVSFIYRFVNSPAIAEELAQDVFLRAFRARHSYEPRARFAAWIYRIATNVGLKEARRRQRMRLWSRDHGSPEDSHGEEESVRDPSPDAERQMLTSELEQAVRGAIRSLPTKEQAALILRRYEDLSYREIAEIMACTEAAVKTYIHRGKLHLRDRILPYLKTGSV